MKWGPKKGTVPIFQKRGQSPFSPQVRIEHVSKAYRQDGRGPPVLDDVSATIGAGEFVVVVGRSGSGKSTLLNLIGAIDLPSAGEIFLGDVAIGDLDETGRALLRRRHIGFVFQSYNLIATLTVGENLHLPLELNGHHGRAAAARVQQWLAAVGLADSQSRWPEELSGGEQQRIAIARALVHEPQLVLADEPTGNLDLATATEVIALLDRLCRDAGTTLLMATHSREVIGRADRVLTIRHARLHEERP
ncbi:MAG: ABC transporter ATP-binding protein [Gammaproteobacteria bacterium]|nr:ABC transporter ATP-binding protein [Gammaproteobacteria bacterium]